MHCTLVNVFKGTVSWISLHSLQSHWRANDGTANSWNKMWQINNEFKTIWKEALTAFVWTDRAIQGRIPSVPFRYGNLTNTPEHVLSCRSAVGALLDCLALMVRAPRYTALCSAQALSPRYTALCSAQELSPRYTALCSAQEMSPRYTALCSAQALSPRYTALCSAQALSLATYPWEGRETQVVEDAIPQLHGAARPHEHHGNQTLEGGRQLVPVGSIKRCLQCFALWIGKQQCWCYSISVTVLVMVMPKWFMAFGETISLLQQMQFPSLFFPEDETAVCCETFTVLWNCVLP